MLIISHNSLRELSPLFRYKHHYKAYKKQGTAYPHAFIPQCHRDYTAEPRTYAEQNYHAEIGNGLHKYFLIARTQIGAQRLGAGTHIAYTHCTGVGVSPYFMKGLHLQRAYKGNERIGNRFFAFGKKSDRKQ